MIEALTGIDLDYRIYNKPKPQIKDSLEQVHQLSKIKGVQFYKIVINKVTGPNKEYIIRLCKRKIFVKRLEISIAFLAIIASILSLIISIVKK